MNIIDKSLKYGVTVAVGVIFILMFGIMALLRVPIQLTPEISQPELSIRTLWPGASPEEVEREIVDKQEEQLESLVGLVEMESDAQTGRSEIYLRFQVGTNLQEALVRTANALQQVSDYPEDSDEPTIKTTNVSDRPIAWFVLQPLPGMEDKIDVYKYRDFAENFIQTRFLRVPGVSDSDVYGGSPAELQVIFDPYALAERGITVTMLREKLRKQNRNVSGGDLDEGKRRYIVRTVGEFKSEDDVRNIILTNIGGRPVYVKDVAEVKVSHDVLRDYVRHNGLPGISINARREIGSNILEVMAEIKKTAADLNKNLLNPKGMQLVQTADKTEYIVRSIDMVQANLIFGGTLAVVILMVFLRSVYSTLVVAIAIPISVIGSFIIVTLMGRTINVIMLAGMAFAVGMVVDASIIVLENIHRHHKMGQDAKTAAYLGAKEVWGAILASTLTTLAVFIPIMFIQQEVGQLFQDIAVAISASVTLSMIVSILVIPPLANKLMHLEDRNLARRNETYKAPTHHFGLGWIGRGFSRLTVNFVDQLSRYRVLQGVVILSLTIPPAVLAYLMLPETEYLPEGDQNVIIGFMTPPQGYNVAEMTRIGDQMEQHYKPYWESAPGSPEEQALMGPAVRNFLFIGSRGRLFAVVKAKDPERAKELIPVLEDQFDKVPGMISFTRQLSLFSRGLSGSRGIDLNFMGPDLVKLTDIARDSFYKIKEILPGSRISPNPGIELGQPQIKIKPRIKQLTELQMTSDDLGYAVAALSDGVYADEVFLDPEKVNLPYLPREGIDLVLINRFQQQQRTQDIENTMVHTPGGRTVPLKHIAEVIQTVSTEKIRHFERQRAVTLEISPPNNIALEEAIDVVIDKIIRPLENDQTLGGDYKFDLSGNADKLEETRDAMKGNFLLAVFITYLLLATLFQHWGYPLIIMLSVPMAAVGGVFGLAFLNLFVRQPLDVLTMLGFIILVGVVVNNAILIVYQALANVREGGMSPQEAVLDSVRTRIRPIFMSTLTSIFGLLPLVAMPGAGSEIYRGIGVVILSGLLFSTIFTLFLIPALLDMSFHIGGSGSPPLPPVPGKKDPLPGVQPEPVGAGTQIHSP